MAVQQDLNPFKPHGDYPHRVALLLEYIGTRYYGCQYQEHKGEVLPTIQNEIQKALRKLNIDTPYVHFSGRTDTGVHARGQVAHFDVPSLEHLDHVPLLTRSLNALLPEDIAIKAAALNIDGLNQGKRFNSQLSATHRWYRYTLYNAPNRSVMNPPDASWVNCSLDTELMDMAARQLVGTSDFATVMGADSSTENTICRINYAQVHQNGNFFIFDIVSNRFLYKMVRNLMGLLVSIGKGERPYSPTVIQDALADEDRATPTWRTEKPDGLSLMAVLYPEPFNVFESDEHVQTLKQFITESKQDESTYQVQNLLCQAP